ncbi:hypothetical protein GCM10010425_08750 [Streptomyces spororaveus]|uniref:Uncharacterized protein n=1 Tax=Streptomyces spororaveus TaxID=284039 RepID=A0ABQ3TNQ0_9ACTN|nr:hypothetical protein Sspor_76150 [Streptomyces spororaveus]
MSAGGARERKLKLMLKLNEGVSWGFESLPRHCEPGWPKLVEAALQSQIIAPVSVFAAEHRIDRAWTIIDG